ncbi:MAG: excalibur calcium-binding domain-containing protein [Gammaproteobacteria bacterium]
MENRFFKGRLERWNDAKGFGFILPENQEREVFIHISAFHKDISRRPKIGDVIRYQLHVDHSRRSRAVNAKIEGVSINRASFHNSIRRKKTRNDNNTRWLAKGIALILFMSAAFLLYGKIQKGNFQKDTSILFQRNRVSEKTYRCEGKTYCSEMTSCEEAKFYLRNCPDTKMDGDYDGVPCESQWCGH